MTPLKIILMPYLVVVLATAGYADEHFPFLAQVSRDSVNVRAGGSVNFENIDKLKRGDIVIVLGHVYEWYKVQPLSSTLAYIRSDYLKTQPGAHFAQVSGHRVNVRAAPNTQATSLGELKKGTWVSVLQETKGWSRLVPPAGTVAWIHQDFLKFQSLSVPDSLLLKPITGPAPVVSPPINLKVQPNIPVLFLRGVLEPSHGPASEQVHYWLLIKGKPAYYFLDMPQMSFFSHTVVDVVGSVIAKADENLILPVLRINKISLVL